MDYIIYVYNFSSVSQMGSELQAGQKWFKMIRVNSVQRVRPIPELGLRTMFAMIMNIFCWVNK